MSCPNLTELPKSSAERTGWPWTVGGPQLPRTLPDGSDWPRVSIVTPSLNQGEFIEETIRSVLLQGYPNLEYAIVDGGSDDGTLDIVRRYEPWLTWWVTEPDKGQVYAVQRGWQQCTGDILAYLNSDDVYMPGAVGRAVRWLCDKPQAPAVSGGELRIDRGGMVLKERPSCTASQWDLLNLRFISQPATFLRGDALDRAGGLDTSYDHVFDFELWLRIAGVGDIEAVPAILAATRWHAQAKTLALRPAIAQELLRAVQGACDRLPSLTPLQRRRVLGGAQALAAKMYARGPRHVGNAAASWAKAFVLSPGSRRDLLRMPLSGAAALLRKLMGEEAKPSRAAGPRWNEWARQHLSAGGGLGYLPDDDPACAAICTGEAKTP